MMSKMMSPYDTPLSETGTFIGIIEGKYKFLYVYFPKAGGSTIR
jgi:hypothetical protein